MNTKRKAAYKQIRKSGTRIRKMADREERKGEKSCTKPPDKEETVKEGMVKVETGPIVVNIKIF